MRPMLEVAREPNVEMLAHGPDGASFLVKIGKAQLQVICSIGDGWDHVSVALRHRLPRYKEMVTIKRMFFCGDETAVEYHMPESEHINIHPFCLHLWRPQEEPLPTPPHWMV